jgi:hypothetical protein
MNDKCTQLDADENIPEIISGFYKKPKIRKISIPIATINYSFQLIMPNKINQSRNPTRCASKIDIRPAQITKNNSESQIRTFRTRTNSIINLSLKNQYLSPSKRPFQSKQPEIKLKSVKYILKH